MLDLVLGLHIHLLLWSLHLSAMVGALFMFCMRKLRLAWRNQAICPGLQWQSHIQTQVVWLWRVLTHCSILSLSLKWAGQNSKFFNVEACLYDLWIGKDSFSRKDFMYIIKEQNSINLSSLKWRTSVCQELQSAKASQKLGERICNTTGRDYNHN